MIGNNHRYVMGTSLTELRPIKIYRPKDAGLLWKGIHHYKLVETIMDTLTEKDQELKQMRWNLSRCDTDFAFCCYIIHPEQPVDSVKLERQQVDLWPSFGFITSNARRHRLTYYAGWANPEGIAAFCGRRWYGKRHTRNSEQRENMVEALGTWEESLEAIWKRMTRMKKVVLSDKRCDRLLIQIANERTIPVGRVKRTIRQIQNLRVITAWDLLIELSRWVPMNPPIRQMNQLFAITELVEQEMDRKNIKRRKELDNTGFPIYPI
jgi:hypothetical protein